jgi:hypothetical protein
MLPEEFKERKEKKHPRARAGAPLYSTRRIRKSKKDFFSFGNVCGVISSVNGQTTRTTHVSLIGSSAPAAAA